MWLCSNKIQIQIYGEYLFHFLWVLVIDERECVVPRGLYSPCGLISCTFLEFESYMDVGVYVQGENMSLAGESRVFLL